MKGHQELCRALGVMETAALEGSQWHQCHKPTETPAPLGLAVLALQGGPEPQSLCLVGVLEVGIPW